MARANARSIVGSYATVPTMKKPVRSFKKTETPDVDRVDPEIKRYAIVRSVLAVPVIMGLFFALRYCNMSEFWSILVAVAVSLFSMIEADAKQFGNRFTVTRYDELTPDTATRFKDASGKTLLIKDVL